MKTLLKFKKFLQDPTVGTALWLAGFGLVGIGEIGCATNDDPDDTISERFRDLPNWLKMFIFLIIGLVLSHLAQWLISAKPEDAAKEPTQ